MLATRRRSSLARAPAASACAAAAVAPSLCPARSAPAPLDTYRVPITDHFGRRKREHRVLAEAPLAAFEGEYGTTGLEELLREVAEATGMELVLLGHVNADTYTTVAAWTKRPPPPLSKGSRIPIVETYCRQELTADAPFVMGDAILAGFAEHPGYVKYGLRAYVGVPVILGDGTTFGTLCAVDTHPRVPSLAGVERLIEASLRVAEELSRRLGAVDPRG